MTIARKLRGWVGWVAAIALVGLTPALMGPSGGFPSRPAFQAVGVGVAAQAQAGTLNTSASLNNGLRQNFTNTSNGVNAFSALTLTNDGGASRIAQMGLTSTTSTQVIFSGGATGEQLFFGTNAAVPISFGVSGAEVLRINGTTGAATFGNAILTNTPPTSGSLGVSPSRLCSGGGACNANSTIPIGGAVTAVLSADGTRNNTTTQTVETDLQITNIPTANTYFIEWDFFVVEASGAPGFSGQVNTPSLSVKSSLICQRNDNGTVTLAGGDFTATPIMQSSAAGPDEIQYKCIFGPATFSASGTVSLQWAQGTAVAANTTMRKGARLVVTRVL